MVFKTSKRQISSQGFWAFKTFFAQEHLAELV